MKHQQSFHDFLRYGRIGQFGINSSREQVLDLFGEPDYWSEKFAGITLKDAHFYHYRGFKVEFKNGLCYTFSVDVADENVDSCITWVNGLPPLNCRIGPFVRSLKRAGIDYERASEKAKEWDVVLKTCGHVSVIAKPLQSINQDMTDDPDAPEKILSPYRCLFLFLRGPGDIFG